VKPHNNTRKKLHEHKHCEAWFPSYSLLMIKEYSVPTSSFHVDTEWDETSGTLLFPITSDWGCVPKFPMKHEMWICRLKLIYGSRMIVLHHMFLLQIWNSWKAWPASSPEFSPLNPYLWGHLISTVFATDFSDIQDLQRQIQNWFLWHLGFSSTSGNQCTDMQHPVLKLNVKVLTIFFHLQESVMRNHASEVLCS
jgi:hypothetical protein